MLDLNRLVGLDFETYSGVDLPKHGLDRYLDTDTFQPLISSLASYDDPWATPMAHTLDFTVDYELTRHRLGTELEGKMISAHNAGFEERVLDRIGIRIPAHRFIDSAVVARAAGAGSSLEAAAPQLLGSDKMPDGQRLIRQFSIPGEYQERRGDLRFDPAVTWDNPKDWLLFQEYCELDAHLSLRIVTEYAYTQPAYEHDFAAVTMEMNNTGWPVDMELVREMHRRYLKNIEVAEQEFRLAYDAAGLNLNSLPQLKAWCLERGIRATSFDDKNVTKLLERIGKKLNDVTTGKVSLDPAQYHKYCEVVAMLETKQLLGGSSLKKLQVILDTVGNDGRLRHQYLHCGAGQTLRTTGRAVQMQNLKRLGEEPDDVEQLFRPDVDWDNEQLARNLRQCFTASDPNGQLIVGDFKSVESRGLAWLADAAWKLDAYRAGQDMYKVLATTMFHVGYDQVSKPQRQAGKVGELSCGYQAGGEAVQAFASGMGIEMSPGEANQLVNDWRLANPEVVALWDRLQQALDYMVDSSSSNVPARHVPVGPAGAGWRVRIAAFPTPPSLRAQHPDARSIVVQLIDGAGTTWATRYFHGCYRRGRSICYYKPSARKTGDLWSSHFTDPKTKQVKFYSVYGGKLTGILTQSFCREIFMRRLKAVRDWTQGLENVDLIGQFHDEIVLDWRPPMSEINPAADLTAVILGMNRRMSDVSGIPGFPLEADIKHDFRYTK